MKKSFENYITRLSKWNFAIAYKKSYRHSYTQLSEIASQLGELLDSGVDVQLAFYTLSKHTRMNQSFKNMLWKRLLEEGKDLSYVFAEYQFPFLFISAIKAGEQSGRLVQSLYLLADYYEKLAEMKTKVSQSLIYPMMILATVLFSFYFMLYFVLPNFKQLYFGLGLTVPNSTKLLFSFQTWVLANQVYIVYVGICIVFLIFITFNITKVRMYLTWCLLYVPFIGGFFRHINTHLLVMQLSMLIKGGLSTQESFQNIDKLFQGPLVREVNKLKQQMLAGESISSTMRKMRCFDQHLIGFIEMGETTGRLDSSFTSAEVFYNMRMKNTIQVFLKSIEPVILFVLGIGVAMIIVTMLLPLFDLLESM